MQNSSLIQKSPETPSQVELRSNSNSPDSPEYIFPKDGVSCVREVQVLVLISYKHE